MLYQHDLWENSEGQLNQRINGKDERWEKHCNKKDNKEISTRKRAAKTELMTLVTNYKRFNLTITKNSINWVWNKINK